MTLLVDTTIGNKIPSPELHRMLVDLQDTTRAMVDSIEEIRQRAYSEGFNEQQTISLIKSYLGKDDKTKRKLRWILDEKPRREAQKKLTNKLATSGTDANMSTPEPEIVNVPTDYKVVVSEEEIKQLEQQEQQWQQERKSSIVFEDPKPNSEVENLELQLDNANGKITELTTQNKNLDEKYKQLEAKTVVQPSNNFPALQGNNLKIKIVVNQVFREILQLKGSKKIYANILIDVSENKYVRLEPA